jgi:NAD(P)-dependent dehydrogenase (short-subunit alcohol dehydrogenase family)
MSIAFQAGQVAVITGAASGIGKAAALKLAGLGLKVVLSDLPGEALDRAAAEVADTAAHPGDVLAHPADVSDFAAVEALRDAAEAFGPVTLLMNNAGAGLNPGKPWENLDGWRRLLDINLWGAVHGVQAFVPGMIARGSGVVVNTGSKQGITLPPGNGAYNLQGRTAGLYRDPGPRPAQRSEWPSLGPPADSRLYLYQHDPSHRGR